MKIDREVEASSPQIDRELQIFPEAARRAGLGRDDDVIEVRIALDDGGGKRFDEIAEVRVGIGFSERLDRRRRQDDIANQSQADQQDTRELVSGYVGNLVNESSPDQPRTFTNSPTHQFTN